MISMSFDEAFVLLVVLLSMDYVGFLFTNRILLGRGIRYTHS